MVPEKVETATEPGNITFVTAIKKIDFGDTDGMDPLNFGYGIDGCCTCSEADKGDKDPCEQGKQPACRRPETSPPICDNPGGHDNVLGGILKSFKTLPRLGSRHWTKGLEDGVWSILFKVSGYSGLPNDASVQVRAYVPKPLKETTGKAPNWTGADIWQIPKRCLAEPAPGDDWDIENTRYDDYNAYVVNNQLVASFSELSFVVIDDYDVKLYGLTMVADIEKYNNLLTLSKITISARWKVQDLLYQLGRIPLEDQWLCPDHPSYGVVKSVARMSVESFVGTPTPTSMYKALSMGMVLEGRPALLGVITDMPVVPEPCDKKTHPPSVY